MGATDSKLAFRKGVFRLFEERNIDVSDEYWIQFWDLPESADDVFSLVGAQDIRRVRDQARENLETLIHKITDQMFHIMRAPDFPSPQNSTLQLLNCIRLLTRIMPFIFESEELDEWENEFFWAPTKKVKKNFKPETTGDLQNTSKKLDDETITNNSEGNAVQESSTQNRTSSESYETIPPLGESLLSALIDLLFLTGFTLPINLPSETSRVVYVNWETGVGSTIPIGSSKENDSNKTETLRLLLALVSKSMYMPGATFISKENKWIKFLVLKLERKVVLALLCSLLNTTVKYNPAGWGVPYNHMVFTDPREMLVTLCLQVLLVLLDYRSPSNRVDTALAGTNDPGEHNRSASASAIENNEESALATSPKNDSLREADTTQGVNNEATNINTTPQKSHLPPNVDNAFRYYASKLHRSQDFQFLMDGIYRILSNPMQANNTYLPGSTKQIRCHQEMLMLLWKFLEINKRFRNYLLETDRVLDILIVLLYYSMENKHDQAQLGFVRMCAFILQTLSADRNFGMKLNKQFEGHGSLPSTVRISAFNTGTYADYMIISIYALIASTRGTLHPLYPAFVLAITNVSPYLKNLSVASSVKLVQLFSSFSSPMFLLADEGNHRLVGYMLEALNNIIQYQFSDNPHVIYAIVCNPKKFEEMFDFTLSKGLAEIKRIQTIKERKKQAHNASMNKSELSLDRKSIHDEPASQPPISDTESMISNKKDDEHEAELNEKTELLSVTSADDRGESMHLSEKARGKLPEGVTAASRQRNSVDNTQNNIINSNSVIVTPFAVGKSGFIPTEDWVSSWHPHLPFGTIQVLLRELVPKVKSMCASQSITTDQKVLDFLRTTSLVGILSPPQPIFIRKFQWSEASVVWFASMLWAQVYLASSSHLGIFNGTNVKLFLVKSSTKEGQRLKNAIGSAVSEGVQGVFDRLAPNNTINPNASSGAVNTNITGNNAP
ncbi:ubp5 interacting protein ftp10 [Gigaspora margarita]|uniref:Ubp5 interacting protein ftp10 n=1 Tax=Gigaspora margarita TaxID=4874 RepID=A0A8H3WU54_GIGMA|nr:ubp5 interacting protein ftp10 [Gigaspora margarita]